MKLDKIISLQDFVADKAFHTHVLPFFHRLNPYFTHYIDNKEAVFILENEFYAFIFLRFVPRNQQTNLPTLEDCFYEFKLRPRISVGEWVVESIHDVDISRKEKLLKDLVSISDSDVYQAIKYAIKK